MSFARLRVTVAAIFLLVPVAVPAQGRLAPTEVLAWRADLDTLGTALRRIHPDPFTQISEGTFDSAVASFAARLPRLRRTQALVELAKLVALIRDGHTTLAIGFDPALKLRYYPLELYWFDDGIFVRKAAPEYRRLVGAKVLRIGNTSIEEAVTAIAPTISHENEWWVRAWAPFRLMIPELLDGLGLVRDMERLPLVVEKGGRRDTVIVAPAGELGTIQHGPDPISTEGWADMRDATTTPLWLRNTDRPYWMEYLPKERLVYVGYNAIASAPAGHGESNAAFWNRVLAFADTVPVDRFVIDLRHNSGGNGFLNRTLVRGLLQRPAIDRPDVLYVLIGRRTFSAAVNLMNDLEYLSEATYVGEPTGMRPVAFGDHLRVRLPNTGVTVLISSLLHQNYNPHESRAFIPPDIYAPLTSDDYRAGRDPVLDAVRKAHEEVPLAHRMGEAIATGDSTRAAQMLHEAINAVANRFRSFEPEVNSLGYGFLSGGKMEEAITAFRINALFYPGSANAFDSLGEALAAAGRREEAIAAYRKALALNPEFVPSREGLARLQ